MRNGYRLLHKFIHIDKSDADILRNFVLENNECVFNPDNLRLQRILDQNHDILKRIEKAMISRGLLRGRIMGEASVLFSHPGCKRQQLHWDYDPAKISKLRIKPLGILFAFEYGTSMYIHNIGKVILQPGDALVFAGDVVHAGDAYPDTSNVRLHLYLDVPSHVRSKNETYLLR